MYLVQFLLPLYDNAVVRFEPKLLNEVRNELVERFGDLAGGPFGPNSRMQICLCRRRG